MRAVRYQWDDRQDEVSQASGLDCSSEGFPDTARQEFKDDADINILLDRFGVETMVRQVTQDNFTTVDFDIDLLQAMDAIGAAKSAFGKLHPEIQEKYPTWQDVLTAIDAGELTMDANGNPLDLSEEKPKETPKSDPE